MFDRGFTLFSVRGIPVKLHVTLLLFIPYVAFVAAAQFRAIAGALDLPLDGMRLSPPVWGGVLAVALFGSILLHELAHSMAALALGVRVRSITLMMLGGISRLEEDVPPAREAWVAFVGPLMSFLIAVAAYLGFRMTGSTGEVAVALVVVSAANVVIGGFNLLPAFPMDGGRVLRSLLARRLGAVRATRVAARVGKAMAIAFALLGLLGLNLLLVLIAAFVFMGASAEEARLEARAVLEGLPVGRCMSDRIGEVRADESARAVAQRLLAENLVGARVVDGPAPDDAARARTVGVVTASDLARRGVRGAREMPVAAAMRTDLPRVHQEDDAACTLDALAQGEASAVVVLGPHDEVIGLVTPADIHRAIALRGAASRDDGSR